MLVNLFKVFNLKELEKGYFLYKFNVLENEDYWGFLSDIFYFFLEFMKEVVFEKFDTWW